MQSHMAQARLHTVYVRGVSKKVKDSIKRQAKSKRLSVNSFLLGLFEDKTIHDIESFEIEKKAKNNKLSDIEKSMK